MQFALTSLLAFVAATSASPLESRKTLDVWNPKILSPSASTVWVVGSTVNVTWDTTDAPRQISNGAAVYLRKEDGPAPLENPFLKEFRSFNLTTGWTEVTVPEVPAADDYSITLFGDSGNWSDKFTIQASGDGEEEAEVETDA